MGKWKPCKRRDFIKKLKKLGFEPPETGGRHFYMRYASYTLTLPGNKEYSVPQIKMLLNEIELCALPASVVKNTVFKNVYS